MSFDDSACRKGILCSFSLSRDLSDARIEVCELCGKKVVYHKVDGGLDDAKYLRDHRRDTLQPYGSSKNLFLKIYGNKPSLKARLLAERIENRRKMPSREELDEKREFMHRIASGHRIIKEKYTPRSFVKRSGFQKDIIGEIKRQRHERIG